MLEQSDTTSNPTFVHINLKTTRLEEMIDWYGVVIGTRVIYRAIGGAFLTNDGANHRIGLVSPLELAEDPEKLTHAGLHHMSFEYDSLDDLLENYERLNAKDIEPHLAQDHGITTSIYYVDPDGNSVELQVDNFGDWRKSTEFMQSTEFDEVGPLGKQFDPQKMLEARQAGASKEELHQRAYAGEWHVEYDLRVPPLPFQ